MNLTTLEELKEITKQVEATMALEDPDKLLPCALGGKPRSLNGTLNHFRERFARLNGEAAAERIDNMTPELRNAITDLDAFQRYLDNYKSFGPKTAELQLWLDNEKKTKGLIDFKFTLSLTNENATIESIAGEILEMLRAPDLPSQDFI